MPTRNINKTMRVIVLLLAHFTIASQQLDAQDPPGPRVPAELMQRATTVGQVRVIVQHTGFVQPEATFATQGDVAFQRAQIASAGDAILATLTQGSVSAVRRLATVPYFAADVDATALDTLGRSPFVIAVHDDRLLEPE